MCFLHHLERKRKRGDVPGNKSHFQKHVKGYCVGTKEFSSQQRNGLSHSPLPVTLSVLLGFSFPFLLTIHTILGNSNRGNYILRMPLLLSVNSHLMAWKKRELLSSGSYKVKKHLRYEITYLVFTPSQGLDTLVSYFLIT